MNKLIKRYFFCKLEILILFKYLRYIHIKTNYFLIDTNNKYQLKSLAKRYFSLIVLCLLFFNNYGAVVEGGYKIKTVVIDAGHGGKDPGCHGASSNEKDVCLSIALKLGAYIRATFPEVKVIFTRETDVFLELHERAKIANDNDADLFISIHANSGPSAAYGTETYVMSTKYVKNNLDIAHENASIFLEEDYEANYETNLSSPEMRIILSLYQQEYLKNSIELATKIEDQFKTRVGLHSRGVKQKVLYVMYKTQCSSVLIETGFLTNNKDEAFLNSEKGQDYLASAIYRAFREYKLEKEGYTEAEIKAFIEGLKTSNAEGEEKESEEENTSNIDEDSVKENEASIDSIPELNNENTAFELFFSVQFASSSEKIPLNSQEFEEVKDVFEYRQNNMFKYASGKYASMKEAQKAQEEMRKKGFKDAFVIAISNGERTDLESAKKRLEE